MKETNFRSLVLFSSLLLLTACASSKNNNPTNLNPPVGDPIVMNSVNYQEMMEEQQLRALEYNNAHPRFGGRR